VNLRLENISKSYEDCKILDEISFEISEGKSIGIMGESGCGKSTLLRIIAGLETPSGGQIAVKDGCGTAMMFQSYALFPHLSVCKNVEFALKLSKIIALLIAIKMR